MAENLSAHEQRRHVLIEIVKTCDSYQESKYEKNVFYGVNIENATQVELRLCGNNLKVLRGRYKPKSMLIRDIDPIKFREYILTIVGRQVPKQE